VRELVAEFRGLTGTAKQKAVLEATGLRSAPLSQLVEDRAIDRGMAARLLAAMQAESKPVRTDALGIIGREHFEECCAACDGTHESFAYRLVKGETGSVPWVVEAAFAYAPGASGRTLYTGINWSPALTSPFRSLGGWTSLDTVLTEQWARPGEPVIVALHLACPRVEYLDRGKSGVALPHDVSAAITSAVTDVTKRWAKPTTSARRLISRLSRSKHPRPLRHGREPVRTAEG
jgi:DNA topoisomerase VI subunit B